MDTNLTNLTDNLLGRRGDREHISHSTMLAYATHCTDSFETEPFNEVDSLLLSWMSYLHIPEEILPKYPLHSYASPAEKTEITDTSSCRIRDFVKEEYLRKLIEEINSPDKTIEIIKAAAENPRFANIRFCLRREERDAVAGKQFAAITCQITPGLTYVAYRGTDHSMTGWKEDFRLCLKDPVPAQKLAAEYLNGVGSIFRGKMLIGGHSKGGNLAVYAAANCHPEIQERILTVYSHDGPGFNKEELEKPGYAKIRSRIQKTAPQFSIFGMLLRQEVEPKIIYSYGHGILQHDATSWKTDWYGLSEYWYPSKVSQHIKNKLNNWIESLSDEEKETFIELVFGVLEQTGIDSLADFKDNMMVILPTLLMAIHELDDSMQMFLLDLLKQFIFASDENMDPVATPATPRLEKYSKYPADIQELMKKYDSMD